MKIMKAALLTAITVLITWALDHKWAGLPPLGSFFNPSTGFWQNAEPRQRAAKTVLPRAGNSAPVTVLYDENNIPHVFAENAHDLYYAQGFVTARERLWQMDLQVRTAAGRMAEVFGPAMLQQDRYYRHKGLTWAAERDLELLLKDPVMREALMAYTEGVNAWIRQLKPPDLPVEFKLLDYAPQEWQPVYATLIFKLMDEVLTGRQDDLKMENTLALLGSDATAELFPDKPFRKEPVIPAGTPWNFNPVPVPPVLPGKQLTLSYPAAAPDKVAGVGSNNWAIAGSRSATGFPLLANDPHLALTLPAIWYQAQLAAPGVNVYGVSIPGIPFIIIGYNNNVAWGLTNSEADVADWYRVQFRDESRREYLYNNNWAKVRRRVEPVRIRGAGTLYDTVLFTHHGPVVYEGDALKQELSSAGSTPTAGLALRWTAYEGAENIKTFYLLNRANTYEDYRQALQYFASPAQNFIFADNSQDIAITCKGKYPLRYKGQGKFVLDGSLAADDWYGFIPADQCPFVRNPGRGFVSSANQPAADTTYPYYLSWQYSAPDRAIRINERLEQMHRATADSFRILQHDSYSTLASAVLPLMLAQLKREALDTGMTVVVAALEKWNYRFDADAIGATIFNQWWNELFMNIWEDDLVKQEVPLRKPSRDKTLQLIIEDPASRWLDDTRTPEREDLSILANRSFIKIAKALMAELGPVGPAWAWGSLRMEAIPHLAGIDAFGTGPFPAGGNAHTINALSAGVGPSWRMVVALGPHPKGYGIFPGGESGNPGSFYYDNLLPAWQQGKLQELHFFRSKEEGGAQARSVLIF